jgi:hypothetical protein
MWSERLDQLDRPLLVCSDRGHLLDPGVLGPLIAYMDEHGVRVVAAQARRALGLATREPGPIQAALAAFEAIGAVPYAARAQADIGALTGDRATYEAGIVRLETLGDIEHLARLAARRRS